ncbi:MAG: phytanoyl-CoA dioxygenase family protein, partial [Alphaproteobacteria bacterium]
PAPPVIPVQSCPPAAAGRSAEIAHLEHHGWMRVRGAVPAELCHRLVAAIESEGVPVHDPARSDAYGGWLRDLVPLWGHQAQWDIRQFPGLHRIWAALWGTEALYATLDSCRFTPPWRPGFAEPLGLHWDQDPNVPAIRLFQGVVALTDTAADQGGFRCVPSLFREPGAWPSRPTVGADGGENWLADTAGREIVHVSAQAGDVIVWDSRLPHGNSRNESDRPRLAFYLHMFPATDAAHRAVAIESWRSGRCVPEWRRRFGYDRIEPWPPARLTPLGRKLIGLDPWPPA